MGTEKVASLIWFEYQELYVLDIGQRIGHIIKLEGQIEERIKRMVISLSIKLAEKEKNLDISEEELQKAVKEKASELVGILKEVQGLD